MRSPETSVSVADAEAELERLGGTSPMTAMGRSLHNRRLIVVVRALERASPLQGRAMLRFLPQAFTYLRRDPATKAVDEAVRPSFEAPGPAIVLGHSLGSVVAFKLMRELRFSTPLYVTFGSPLAIRAVQGPLGTPFGRRPAVKRWCNFHDVDDFVTLGRALDGEIFGDNVENTTVENPPVDPHAHAGYLAQPTLGRLIVETIRGI